MKILHLIDSGGLYGAEMMLLNLVSEQVRCGLEPIIASIGELGSKEKPLESEALRRGLRVEKFRMRPGPNLFGALRILRFLRAEEVCLLHSHGFKADILFGLLPRALRRLPMVSTVHGWTNTGGLSKMRLYEWLDAKSLKFIDKVVLVNAAMAGHVRLQALRGRYAVVNNGLPTPLQGEPAVLDEEVADFCRGGFTLCAIGRLSTEKGFDLLIDAFHKNARDFSDLRLVIFGEGRRRHSLETQIRELGLRGRVFLPGYLPDARSYLPLCQAFVLSSLTEGLPIVLLEAMLAGVPVIATRVGGVPEVLAGGDVGILVNRNSSDELAAAIMRVRNSPDGAKRMTKKARQRVCDHYSSAKMAIQYQDIYQSLLHSFSLTLSSS